MTSMCLLVPHHRVENPMVAHFFDVKEGGKALEERRRGGGGVLIITGANSVRCQ